MTITEQLKRDEGLRLKVYKDTATPPRLTIGVGRNLTDNGISEVEADFLLTNDINKAVISLTKVGYSGDLTDPRYAVLVSMLFNVGPAFLKWKNTLGYYKSKNYSRCADELLSSEPWASQVKNRASRLALQMRLGEWV